MIITFAAILLLAVAGGARGECMRNGARCLEYTVLQTNEVGRYEVRSYPSIVWVSATGDAKDKSDISKSLIRLLYAYLGGANEKGKKLDMMVPVRTKKVVKENINTYTMSLALLPEQSEDPPAPTNQNVTLLREPSTVYVITKFGGRAREDATWDSHADNLKNTLAGDESMDIDTSFYYMCVYDSPWRETDRLNEVWMVKKE